MTSFDSGYTGPEKIHDKPQSLHIHRSSSSSEVTSRECRYSMEANRAKVGYSQKGL